MADKKLVERCTAEQSKAQGENVDSKRDGPR